MATNSTEELLREVERLRQRVAELEGLESERIRTEKALQEQVHFLQTLIDTIPNPIFIKDTSGTFIGCNKAFERRLGRSREEIIGKSSFDLFPTNFAEVYHRMDVESFRHPGEQVYETSILYGDGKPYDVIIYKGTFTNVEGELAGVVGMTVDITERKQAEEGLRKARDELEQRVAERTSDLALANQELRSEIAERRRAEKARLESAEKFKLFAFSVTHDLKSPTMGIYGLTKLLRRKYGPLLDETGREYCDQILKASENVAALVEKVNIYAATMEVPISIELVSVKEVLRMVKGEFAARLAARHVHWFEPDVLPSIRADRLGLLRLFRNLVDNALKYGGERLTEIRIGYEESEDFHILSVSDNGQGLQEGDRARIFESFQRQEPSHAIEGIGLGLAIVKKIAEQHQGRVWVESEPRSGATFFISLSKNL